VILYFDVNFVDDETPAAHRLRQYHAEGWITLIRSDTLDTELENTKDESKREELLAASRPYIESLGPGVVGSSRVGHMLIASDNDAAGLDRVYSILFPGSDRRHSSHRKVRDAMHVATAIRYGGHGSSPATSRTYSERRARSRKRSTVSRSCRRRRPSRSSIG